MRQVSPVSGHKAYRQLPLGAGCSHAARPPLLLLTEGFPWCCMLFVASAAAAAAVAGVCCAFGADGTLVIDPDAAEEAAAGSVITAAFPCSHTLTQQHGSSSSSAAVPALSLPEASLLLHCKGRLGAPQLASGLEGCRRGCQGVAKFVALALTNSFKVRAL